MKPTVSDLIVGQQWTDVAACALPTADRPQRLAEFDDLFATSLETADWASDTRVRLLLTGDRTLVDRIQQLVDAESSCCAFFRFDVRTAGEGRTSLEIQVPRAYADVLAGLVTRAQSVRTDLT